MGYKRSVVCTIEKILEVNSVLLGLQT